MKIDDNALDNMRSKSCPCNNCKGGEYSGKIGEITKLKMIINASQYKGRGLSDNKNDKYHELMKEVIKISMNSLYGQPKNYQNLIPPNTITLTEENMQDYIDVNSIHPTDNVDPNYSPRHAARHARATETPNVVIENPKIRKAIGTVLDIALLILFTSTAVDMASETIDISAFTVPAMAGVGALRAGFGLVVTNPNTPHEKA